MQNIYQVEALTNKSLGLLERFFIHRHHLKLYNSVAVTATYTAPRKLLQAAGNIESLVYTALQTVINKQAILGVTVQDADTPEPKWVRLESIDLSRVVSIVDIDPKSNLDTALQTAHTIEFEPVDELPLWRVVIFALDSQLKANNDSFSFGVGFFFHHGIGDGLSGKAFHLSFLPALNELSDTKFIQQSTIQIPKLPLIPNVELNAEFPVTIWFALKQIINEFVFSRASPLSWTGPLVPTTPPTTRPTINIRSFSLPSPAITTLLAKCRAEGTSLTALFAVLVARKLALMYPTHSRFSSIIPFSLRKFSGHTPLDIGVYFSGATTSFSSETPLPSGHISCASPAAGSEDTALWDSARAYKASIATLTSSPANQGVGLIKFVKNNLPGFFLGKLGKARENAFEISNIMSLDGTSGEVSIERVHFTATLATFAVPFLVDVASVKGGDMTACVCWDPTVVEEKDAGEMSSWFEGQVRGLCEE